MSKVLVTEQHLEDIADAIRGKNGTIATYKPEDMADAIDDLVVYPEPTGTKDITSNGLVSVKDYEFADVDVAGSFTPEDEGKVVSNGALVAQGSDTITENGTYDTTLISELIANIAGGGGAFFDPKHFAVDADSTYSSNVSGYGYMLPEKAVAGQEKRHWWGANSKASHWLKITFTEAVKVTKIRFSNYWHNGNSTWLSTEVTLQGSSDDTNWTDLLALTNLDQSEEQREYAVSNSAKYLYYRFVVVNASATTNYTGLGKVQLYIGDEEGGGVNILSGTDVPTSSVGSDGAIYLQYGLPSGYTPVEYVTTGSGSQTYAGIPIGSLEVGDILEYSASKDTWSSGTNVFVGVKTSYGQSSGERMGLGVQNNERRIFIGSGTVHDTDDPTQTASGGQVIQYGETITSGKYKQSITIDSFATGSYYLYYGAYASNSWIADVSLYRAVLKRANGTIKKDIVPCIRDSDSKAGFYELISGVFYAPSAGTFTASAGTYEFDGISATYLKVNGAWQNLIGSDIDDVDTGGTNE